MGTSRVMLRAEGLGSCLHMGGVGLEGQDGAPGWEKLVWGGDQSQHSPVKRGEWQTVVREAAFGFQLPPAAVAVAFGLAECFQSS